MTAFKTPRGRSQLAVAAAIAVLTWACGDPLKKSQLIEENRVLAAQVQVSDDPDRASVAPGERASVRWLVVDPEQPRPLSWAFAVCAAEPVSRGIPRCARAPFVSFASGPPDLLEPRLDFTLPDAEAFGDTEQLALLGVICADGHARLGTDWADTTCEGEQAQTTLVSLNIAVDRADSSNQNPSLDDLSVSFDNSPWPELEPGSLERDGCDALLAELPRVAAASGEHELLMEPSARVQEPLVPTSRLDPERETFQLEHYSTAGELERPVSVIEATAESRRLEVAWEAPAEVGDEGLVVRFYLVGRDLRGGVDWTMRALCVTPE